MLVQQYQNITHTGFALLLFPQSADPNMSSFGYKILYYLTC